MVSRKLHFSMQEKDCFQSGNPLSVVGPDLASPANKGRVWTTPHCSCPVSVSPAVPCKCRKAQSYRLCFQHLQLYCKFNQQRGVQSNSQAPRSPKWSTARVQTSKRQHKALSSGCSDAQFPFHPASSKRTSPVMVGGAGRLWENCRLQIQITDIYLRQKYKSSGWVINLFWFCNPIHIFSSQFLFIAMGLSIQH